MNLRGMSILGLMLVVTGCSASTPPAPSTPPPSTPRPATTAPVTTAPATARSSTAPRSTSTTPSPGGTASTTAADRVLAGMSLEQRVGQLIMAEASADGPDDAALAAIRDQHVGALILMGRSAGLQGTRQVTAALQAAAPQGVGLFIATDQEGGEVQRLQGDGFSAIPSALQQGTIDPAVLRQQAALWGGQLRHAGVTVDLAPVLDTVPGAAAAASNPPIGQLDREYGYTPAAVSAHGVAVAQGLGDAGVVATVKHFPGLGRVSGNTDNSAGVTDTVTTVTDPYLEPFAAAVRAGVPFVMISTAIYTRIDPAYPAAFSHAVITGLLRGRLGFTGVVITDDVGAAAQVAEVPVGQRAVDLVAAGGDITLTVDDSQVATMTAALISRAQSDPAFRALIDAAALRVLRAKQKAGLLT